MPPCLNEVIHSRVDGVFLSLQSLKMVLFVLLFEVVKSDGPGEQKREQQECHHAAEDAQAK